MIMKKLSQSKIEELTTVVVRSCGERTEKLCVALLWQQISPDNIIVIRDTPFVKTLRRSFETAISQNRKWTLCIDADLLVRPGYIQDVIEFAEGLQSDVFEVKTVSYDKFFTSPREVGQRLYRTKLLSQAAGCIDTQAAESLRPESYVISKLWEKGNRTENSTIFTGIHDCQQYYRDIYRKCFTHGVKTKSFVNFREVVDNLWSPNMVHDPDFLVAVMGHQDSLCNTDSIKIDASNTIFDTFNYKLSDLGLEEKPPLALTPETIDELFNNSLNDTLKLTCWFTRKRLASLPSLATLQSFNRFLRKHISSRIAIWGAGTIFSQSLVHFIPRELNSCIIDSNSYNRIIFSHYIRPPKEIQVFKPDYVIVIPENHIKEIATQVDKLYHSTEVIALSGVTDKEGTDTVKCEEQCGSE